MLFIVACSTEKNTFISRSYHNLTAHYNAYFNGNESLKAGVKKIATNNKDDFSKILPVFLYTDEALSKSVYPDMDNAIKKASKVISMHSIKVRPNRKKPARTKRQKEFMKKSDYCNWIDDSYMLMGKSNFYKHEFLTAEESFQYVLTQFSYEPIKYHALMWLARNNNELKRFNKSKEILDQLDGDRKFPKKYKAEVAAIYADYYLKQEKYEDAIPHLRLAIDKGRKKRDRARYKFILAQIYQNLKESSKATKLYAEVIKMNPYYEMVFNAQINRSMSFESSYGNSKGIKKQLNKMIHDDKNIEYLDQLYYALGNISLKENNENEAIEYYKLSSQKSVSNNNQKALSFLALANLYFSKPKYKEAQAYYDSTMSFISQDHKDYIKISLLSKNLNELIIHANTIQFEDSVQKIAKMTEKDRNKLIDDIIEKIREEEIRLQEEQRQQQINSMIFNQNQQSSMMNNNNNNSSGKWYFYNQGMIGVGMSEFKRKWGTRKLEDNWRRKNKSIVMQDLLGQENTEQGSTDNSKKNTNTKSREYYLHDIPLSDSAYKASSIKVVDAYYNLGKVYKELFSDYKQAIVTFEEMNKRFPENTYLLSTYYYLYHLHNLEKNPSRAEYYKNLIIQKFPDSKYAKALLDPDYMKKAESDMDVISNIYNDAYEAYNKGNYTKTLELCNNLEKTYSENIYSPNIKFLKSVSYGKTNGLGFLAEELNKLISDYPNHEVVTISKDILSKMAKMDIKDQTGKPITFVSSDSLKQDSILNKELEIYSVKETDTHFYIILADNKKVDANRLQFNVVNFNSDFFSMIDFNVSIAILNDTYNMITVKSFDNKQKAYNYFKAIELNKDVFANFDKKNYYHFVISSNNFATFYNDKDILKYLRYFNKNYK